ncbi:hypothetical protein A9Q84_09260 [Halobacteriovorax marinus]|uniref:Uncharacterized protein n=1 Tax=Halobacteriovorax marinus TaxID=97084 RepID=A0A1Y5F6L2_9BACT|nr:hypothetical protein A9Q84_09260 [Halobacteriovorax marinus]
MNSQENGISLQLQKFKESTSKKRQEFQKKAILRFLLIFILSHLLRTLTTESVTEEVEIDNQIKDGHVQMSLEVQSLIPKSEREANLFHKEKRLEIEKVQVLDSKNLDTSFVLIKVELPSTSVSKIVENPRGWKLIPKRKITNNKKVSYEILL